MLSLRYLRKTAYLRLLRLFIHQVGMRYVDLLKDLQLQVHATGSVSQYRRIENTTNSAEEFKNNGPSTVSHVGSITFSEGGQHRAEGPAFYNAYRGKVEYWYKGRYCTRDEFLESTLPSF